MGRQMTVLRYQWPQNGHELCCTDILNLHNLGMFSCAAMYGLLLFMLFSAYGMRHQTPAVAGIGVLAISLILLIDSKVLYAYARNGFSIMIVPVLLVWWEAARSDSGRLCLSGYAENSQNLTTIQQAPS